MFASEVIRFRVGETDGTTQKTERDNVLSDGTDKVRVIQTKKYFDVDEYVDELGTHMLVQVRQQEYPNNPVPEPPTVEATYGQLISVKRFANPIVIGSYKNDDADVISVVKELDATYGNPGSGLSHEDIIAIREFMISKGLVPYSPV